jgi:hypothetical protein
VTHTIRTETQIDAPPERVWAVLSDFATYPEWNPFIVSIDGERVPGGTLAVTLRLGERDIRLRPRVVRWEPGRTLRWFGEAGGRWVFAGEHGLTVEPSGTGGTRFVHDEHFRGAAVPFLGRMLRRTESAFHTMDAALKQRVEGRATG